MDNTIPRTWCDWASSNLSRGCNPKEIYETLDKHGFDRDDIKALLGDKFQPHFESYKRPYINTTSTSFDHDGRRIEVAITVNEPRIVLLCNVLSDEECDRLVSEYSDKLLPSDVVSNDNGANVSSGARTSHGAYLTRGETELVSRIENRLASLANWPLKNCEGMQILKYEKGQEYQPHFDWFNVNTGAAVHLLRGGQRAATMVVYLTNVEDGGATGFPEIGLEITPSKGSVVFFTNVDAVGNVDLNSLHAGRPVRKGLKQIATLWLREREFV